MANPVIVELPTIDVRTSRTVDPLPLWEVVAVGRADGVMSESTGRPMHLKVNFWVQAEDMKKAAKAAVHVLRFGDALDLRIRPMPVPEIAARAEQAIRDNRAAIETRPKNPAV